MCFHGLDPSPTSKEKNESEPMKTGGRGLGGGAETLPLRQTQMCSRSLHFFSRSDSKGKVRRRDDARFTLLIYRRDDGLPGFSLRFLIAALLQDWEGSRK